MFGTLTFSKMVVEIIEIMQVELIDVDKLKEFERNPKKHPDDQIKRIVRSIQEFGFTNPILALKENSMVVAGHARLKAAKQMNLAQVPVIFLDMPYEKAIAYVIADNRLAELASWDNTMLPALLDEIKLTEIDVTLTGFDLGIKFEKTGIDPTTIDPLATEGDLFVSNAKKHEAKREVVVDSFDYYDIGFSGGKDSTMLALWALDNLPREKLILKYWDSGWNFEEETKYVLYFAEKYKLKLIWCGHKNTLYIYQQMREHGYPHYGNLWCQSRLKIKALNEAGKYLKENLSTNILTLIGIRKAESKKRQDYPEFAKISGTVQWYPIRDFSDVDLIDFFKQHNEKINPMYNFTIRTGCVFCPNASVATRNFIKEKHPEESVKINECIVEALNDKYWAEHNLINTIKLFNTKRETKNKETFEEVAFSYEEFDKIKPDLKNIDLIDIRQ